MSNNTKPPIRWFLLATPEGVFGYSLIPHFIRDRPIGRPLREQTLYSGSTP